MTTHPNGSFYIDDLTHDFYLRVNGEWVLKGNLGGGSGSGADRAEILFGSGPPPSGGVIGQQILTGDGAPT